MAWGQLQGLEEIQWHRSLPLCRTIHGPRIGLNDWPQVLRQSQEVPKDNRDEKPAEGELQRACEKVSQGKEVGPCE